MISLVSCRFTCIIYGFLFTPSQSFYFIRCFLFLSRTRIMFQQKHPSQTIPTIKYCGQKIPPTKPIYSFIRSFVQYIHSFNVFIYSFNIFIDSLIHWLIHWFIDSLIDSLIDWLIDWLSDWMIDWLIDSFIHLFIHPHTHSLSHVHWIIHSINHHGCTNLEKKVIL